MLLSSYLTKFFISAKLMAGPAVHLLFVDGSKPWWSSCSRNRSYVQDRPGKIWVDCSQLDPEICYGMILNSFLTCLIDFACLVNFDLCMDEYPKVLVRCFSYLSCRIQAENVLNEFLNVLNFQVWIQHSLLPFVYRIGKTLNVSCTPMFWDILVCIRRLSNLYLRAIIVPDVLILGLSHISLDSGLLPLDRWLVRGESASHRSV